MPDVQNNGKVTAPLNGPSRSKPHRNLSPAQVFNQSKVRPNIANGLFAMPPISQYAAVWNQGTHTYRTRFDEASYNGTYTNLVAMRRDAFIQQLLLARCMPTAQLDFHIDPEDPMDEEQLNVASEIEKILKGMPFWTQMILQLLSEGVFGGRAASQIAWDYVNYDGIKYLAPIGFAAVQTDKIIFEWDGTPGILVWRAYEDPNARFGLSDRGRVLFFDRPAYRDRLILFKFLIEDMEWLVEPEQQGARHGLGLRHYAWHTYRELIELKSFLFDALQRVGTSGMLYGYFDESNEQQQQDVIDALTKLCRDNVAAFPRKPDQNPQSPAVERIEPSKVGYDVLMQTIHHHEDILRKLFIGQSLSDSAGSTGLGSGVADLHANTLAKIISLDSQLLSECLNKDLIAVLMKYNFPACNFRCRIRFEHERPDMLDKAKVALALHKTGVNLDQDNLRDIGGFAAPAPGEEIPGIQESSKGGFAAPASGEEIPGIQESSKDGLALENTLRFSVDVNKPWQILEVPDVVQPNHFSCGACATLACCQYFGKCKDMSIGEISHILGTDIEQSTKPSDIVNYINSIGLRAVARHGMAIDDLRDAWLAGHPVIVCCQDYTNSLPSEASFDYGHYLVFIGCAEPYLLFQDSSADNVTHDSGSDASPGKVLVEKHAFEKFWHDKDVDGNKYTRYGIIVSEL